jgi:hypothetical protein
VEAAATAAAAATTSVGIFSSGGHRLLERTTAVATVLLVRMLLLPSPSYSTAVLVFYGKLPVAIAAIRSANGGSIGLLAIAS